LEQKAVIRHALRLLATTLHGIVVGLGFRVDLISSGNPSTSALTDLAVTFMCLEAIFRQELQSTHKPIGIKCGGKGW